MVDNACIDWQVATVTHINIGHIGLCWTYKQQYYWMKMVCVQTKVACVMILNQCSKTVLSILEVQPNHGEPTQCRTYPTNMWWLMKQIIPKHILKVLCFCLNLFVWIILTSLFTHAGHIGTDRSPLTGQNALLLRQIARDLLHALLHRHNNTWTAFF